MIEPYSAAPPNGHRVSNALEEPGPDYRPFVSRSGGGDEQVKTAQSMVTR